jgi:hypothetical protein
MCSRRLVALHGQHSTALLTALLGRAWQRPLTHDAALPAGNAEWLDKGKAQCLVYWRKVSALTSLHGTSCRHDYAVYGLYGLFKLCAKLHEMRA